MKVRTRMAPSPTGMLHVGGLRTALYDYLFAKQNNGKVILRVEDTDRRPERWKQEWEDMLYIAFDNCGIIYDESPIVGGDFGPYRQSERLDIYKKWADAIESMGLAYRETNDEGKEALKIDYKKSIDFLIQKGSKFIKTDQNGVTRIAYHDEVLGDSSLPVDELYDYVLIKGDMFPTYQFACVVDDHFMDITHVFRGSDHTQSTYIQIVLYEVFGWETPKFAHFTLQTEADKKKLSKRKGSVSVEGFIAEGYLPEAIINFLFLLGFAPKGNQEFFTIEEMIKVFDLSRCNKSSSIFDREKFRWMNGQYIKKLDEGRYLEIARKFSSAALEKFKEKYPKDFEEKFNFAALQEKQRIHTFGELAETFNFYFGYKAPEAEVLNKRNDENIVKKILELSAKYLQGADFEKLYKTDGENSLEENLEKVVAGLGLSRGEVFWVVRVKATGQPSSPGVFEVLHVLGKEESLKRLLSQ